MCSGRLRLRGRTRAPAPRRERRVATAGQLNAHRVGRASFRVLCIFESVSCIFDRVSSRVSSVYLRVYLRFSAWPESEALASRVIRVPLKFGPGGASFCSPALRSTAVAPRRPALPSLGDSERDRRSRSQPRPRCPGSAASRSTFLPTSWSAPREPAPESSLLGRSRPRTSARRPSRRSMCGRACTPRYTRGRTCADRCGKSPGCLAGSAV